METLLTRQARLLQLLLILTIVTVVIWNSKSCPKPTVTLKNACQLSLTESDDLICESNTAWKARKHTYQFQEEKNRIRKKRGPILYDNWEQNFHCANARRAGYMGEGGKWVCDLFRLKARHDCLIYSAGSNGEFSFEIEMKKSMPHCEIHTFDTFYHKYPNDTVTYHTITLGNEREPPGTKNWTTIVQELNHTSRIVDVFKMDIEGSEFSFLPLIFAGPKNSYPRQILVELHPRNNESIIHDFFERLRDNGYVIFSKEANIIAGADYYEYGFVRLNTRFFN